MYVFADECAIDQPSFSPEKNAKAPSKWGIISQMLDKSYFYPNHCSKVSQIPTEVTNI